MQAKESDPLELSERPEQCTKSAEEAEEYNEDYIIKENTIQKPKQSEMFNIKNIDAKTEDKAKLISKIFKGFPRSAHLTLKAKIHTAKNIEFNDNMEDVKDEIDLQSLDNGEEHIDDNQMDITEPHGEIPLTMKDVKQQTFSKSWHCIYCKQKFATPNNLQIHMKHIHPFKALEFNKNLTPPKSSKLNMEMANKSKKEFKIDDTLDITNISNTTMPVSNTSSINSDKNLNYEDTYHDDDETDPYENFIVNENDNCGNAEEVEDVEDQIMNAAKARALCILKYRAQQDRIKKSKCLRKMLKKKAKKRHKKHRAKDSEISILNQFEIPPDIASQVASKIHVDDR